MQVFQGAKGGLIKAWIDGVQVETQARAQLDNIAAMPFVHKHVAVMPDVHWGMGATVGSVIPTKGAIIPAAVGVDIGCGMAAQRTTLTASDLPDNLHALRTAIEERVPHGRTDNGGANDRGAWGDLPEANAAAFAGHTEALAAIAAKHPKIAQAAQRAPAHAGTLGTGNHFIEVCLDEEDRVWFMLHSGSRGIGNRIGTYFIERAKAEMKRWFINLPDQDLAYVVQGSALFDDYWEALGWAQGFARTNRDLMMTAALEALSVAVTKPFTCDCEAVNCHHNYVAWERHFGDNVMVTRKGAVKVTPDTLGIIPGSMGAKSFIVRGKAGEAATQALNSCSHGAGRAMSRGEAKRRFTLADHAAAVAGVECRVDEDVIDETPMAYKDIDAVMAAQADHVEIVHTLKQVVCVKG
ncbi:MAG TPA: RtcB family protein [Caulobacteraceae bacterium]|jgi:tRNA-splicing ligase RtcB|nr:RtcB family protein [Caulobacteraceae bacterium]